MMLIHRALPAAILLALMASADLSAQQTSACAAASLSADRAVVCRVVEQERAAIAKLQAVPANAAHCALTRTSARLDRMLVAVTTETGVVPVSFTLGTVGTEGLRRELFPAAVDAVVIELLEEGATAPATACFANEHRAALLTTAGAVSAAATAYNQSFLDQGAANLRKLADTWAWIITDGFGQYPWERAFNDLVHREPKGSLIADLPAIEWVLAHPSVGLTMSGLGALRESRGQTAFLLEPFGFTRYRFDVLEEKRSYWGVSSLMVMTQGLPPAFGGLVRLNRYSIGVVRHLGPAEGESGRWAVTATMELLERLQPARKELQKAGKDAAAQAPVR